MSMPGSAKSGEGGPDFGVLFERAPAAMIAIDRRLSIVAISDRYLAATGTEREAVLGSNVLDVFSARLGAAGARTVRDLEASFARVLSAGIPDVMAVRRRGTAPAGANRGEARFWRAHNAPVLGEDGSVAYVVHLAEDVTHAVESEPTYRLLAEHAADVITRVSLDGIYRYVSPSSASVMGWDPEDLLGRDAAAFVHPDDAAAVAQAHAMLFSGSEMATSSFRFRHAAGHYRWVETTSQAVRGADGAVAEIQSATRDITARREVEETLRRSEALHRTLTENLPQASMFLLDQDLRILVAEGEAMRELPWFAPDMFRGRRVDELHGRAPEHIVTTALEHYAAALRGERREFDIETNGMTFTINATPVHAEDGSVETALVVARDVTRRKAAERQQRAVARMGQFALSDRELGAVLEEAVAVVAETLGVEISMLLELGADGAVLRPIARVGLRDELVPPEGFAHRADSQAGWALSAGEPLVVTDLAGESRFTPSDTLLAHGVSSGMTVVVGGRERPFGTLGAYTADRRTFGPEDVDFLSSIANVVAGAIERDRELQASRSAALHDELTGLPNRALALARLDHALDRRHRDGTRATALVLDIDRFKVINDSLGHAAGDELIVALGRRLADAMRGGDTVARLGGDEFAVICDTPRENRDVVTVAERVMAAVGRPFVISSGEHFVSASLGIAIAGDRDDSAASLLRDADAAMHRAKKVGPGRYELFDEAMRTQVVSRLRIEGDLRRAINGHELRVHYQPIIDLATQRPVALEALVRWEHPERGLLAPDEFIPVAEETGLVVDLGRWVLAAACAQAAEWQRRFDLPLGLSVNVSGGQLSDLLFPAEVAEAARRSGLREHTLTLEVTETVLIGEAGSPATVLDKLREHGLNLVLDDFGTGYSALSYLKHFPLDGIKLDRAFVRDLGADPADTAITQAIIAMASGLGMSLTAEGVETEAQCDHLRELGCTRGQGYLFARPLPARAMAAFLAEHGGAGAAKPRSWSS